MFSQQLVTSSVFMVSLTLLEAIEVKQQTANVSSA